MNAPAVLLARSNSVAGVKLVKRFGCDNDPKRERDAGRNADANAFDFCHVVIGTKSQPPRFFSERLRLHRDGATTWIAGTYGDVMRTLSDDRMDPSLASGFCSALQRAIDGLEPFGNTRFFAVRKGVEVPTSAEDLRSAGTAEGGIFILAADQRAERELVQAGGRIIDRVTPGEAAKPWADTSEAMAVEGTADVLRVGMLALPLSASDVTDDDLKLLRPLADAYARLQKKATNRALAGLLRYEFEATSLLVGADRGVFAALAASEYGPAQDLAAAALKALDATAEAPAEKRASRTARVA